MSFCSKYSVIVFYKAQTHGILHSKAYSLLQQLKLTTTPISLYSPLPHPTPPKNSKKATSLGLFQLQVEFKGFSWKTQSRSGF